MSAFNLFGNVPNKFGLNFDPTPAPYKPNPGNLFYVPNATVYQPPAAYPPPAVYQPPAAYPPPAAAAYQPPAAAKPAAAKAAKAAAYPIMTPLGAALLSAGIGPGASYYNPAIAPGAGSKASSAIGSKAGIVSNPVGFGLKPTAVVQGPPTGFMGGVKVTLAPAPGAAAAAAGGAPAAAVGAPAGGSCWPCGYGQECKKAGLGCKYAHDILKPGYVQLFHATNLKAAELIWNEFQQNGGKGGLRASASGAVGPGVYFCPRPSDCAVKALQLHNEPLSVLISIQVPINKIRVIGHRKENQPEKLDVLYLRSSDDVRPGPEIIIKDIKKIELIGMFEYRTNMGKSGWNAKDKLSLSYRKASRKTDFDDFNKSITYGQVLPTPFFPTVFDLETKTRKEGERLKLIDYMPMCPTKYCADNSILHNIQYVHPGIGWDDVDSDKLIWENTKYQYQEDPVQPVNKHGFLGNKRTPKKKLKNPKKSKSRTRKSNRK